MKKLLTLLLFCLALPSLAQINFESGYFINNQGTKTECLIKNLAWKNSPTSFEYKTADGTETQTYNITDIKEFGVSGYKFVKHTVSIDRTSDAVGNLNEKKDPEFKTETVMLKVLVEGGATLYQYEDGNLTRFFYSTESEAQPQQLVYKVYKTGVTINYNNTFRQQLYNAMAPKIADKDAFSNLRYDKKDLVKLFLKYNGNEGEVKNLSESQNKTSLNFKLTPGVSFSTMDTEHQPFATPNSHSFNKPVFRIGVEVELVLPFNNNKWSVFTDPNYYKFKDSYTSDNGGVQQDWKLNYSCVEVPIGLRHYMYLGKEARLFLDAAYVFALNASSKSKLDYSYASSAATYALAPDFNSAGNLALGLGFSYGRYSAEARYNFKRKTLSSYISWIGDYSSAGIILGYRIF